MSPVTNLHNFSTLINYTNSEGGHPYGALVLAGSNVLYGTAYGGGIGCGTFFRLGVIGGCRRSHGRAAVARTRLRL